MKTAVRKAPRPPRRFAAAEKCRAVLLVWTEKCSTSQLAREMGLTWTVISQWQEQAMAGMLGALEPRRRTEPRPSSLNARLQQLLERSCCGPAPAVPPLTAGPPKRLTEPRDKPPESPPPP